jgi:hypothetical protein
VTVTNLTPFATQELYLVDADGRDLLAVVVKATYELRARGSLVVAAKQAPVEMSGTYNGDGDPEISSPRFEPEVAPFKLATDVVLIGHAHAQQPNTTRLDVGIQVGPVSKVARIFGDRVWTSSLGFRGPSHPVPFETMPLIYERAFGGWDRTPGDEDRHMVEARNPVGIGYRPTRHSVFEEGAPLPNIEDPNHGISDFADTPIPVGFGFTGPSWTPRKAFGGTYDEAWVKDRMPLLPTDFDPRFYSAASPGLIAPGYLDGNEEITIVNATPEGRVTFSLPGEPPPRCTVVTRTRPDAYLEMQLDTVIIDTDASSVMLLWRGHTTLADGPHGITDVVVTTASEAAMLSSDPDSET